MDRILKNIIEVNAMPRIARQKSGDSIYHVMSRSISEVDLFKDDEDKVVYLSKIRKYQKAHMFRVYCYCLMDNHLHLIIDANGADISTIMQSINFSYAQYFNRKHKRHGHLFQDRFKSKIIPDERYLLTATAYIHNNVLDIAEFATCPEKYMFSSLGIYTGVKKDPYELVNDHFIKDFYGINNRVSRHYYKELVLNSNDNGLKDEIEFENEGTEYKSCRKILVRNFKVESIIEFVSNRLNITKQAIFTKGSKKLVEAKAIIVVLMRSLCNLNCPKICEILGNITQATVSKLSSTGIELIIRQEKYANIFDDFIKCYSV